MCVYVCMYVCMYVCIISKQREIQRSPPMMATSYDIQTSPTLSRRPPMKSNNNTFEIIEDKK